MEIDNIDKLSAVLESIAKRYPRESEEYRSIEVATKALFYIYTEKQSQKFRMFLKEFNSELKEEQRQHLKRMGLDPN